MSDTVPEYVYAVEAPKPAPGTPDHEASSLRDKVRAAAQAERDAARVKRERDLVSGK